MLLSPLFLLSGIHWARKVQNKKQSNCFFLSCLYDCVSDIAVERHVQAKKGKSWGRKRRKKRLKNEWKEFFADGRKKLFLSRILMLRHLYICFGYKL